MKYLIAIDIDGTLRHDDGVITNNTKKVVKKVNENFGYVVLCTARPRYYCIDMLKEIGINGFVISSNGAEIYDNVKKETIYANYINNKKVLKIYKFAEENDVRIILVTDNKEYVSHFTRNNNQILLNNCNELSNINIKQIMLIDKDKKKIQKASKTIEKDFKMTIVDSSCNRDESWISVASKKASKGNAIQFLLNNLKIDKSIAIGNDKNDISMLKIVDYPFVVENATKYVKSFAKDVIPSNNKDGVEYILKKIEGGLCDNWD